ncbi:hypothetical protein BDQ17DRAFT_1438441 [Cyathus striatus]|nr:hypothetical protein BDQ17DRAFT_1438441 [Cyathus striatus]
MPSIPSTSTSNPTHSVPLASTSNHTHTDNFNSNLDFEDLEEELESELEDESEDELEDDLESLLPDTVGGKYESEKTFSNTLERNGKKYLKNSLVASLTSNHSQKVTMRPLRVQGMAIEDLYKQSKFQNVAVPSAENSAPCMKSTDLCAFLARVGKEICLAVLAVVGFRYKEKDAQTRSIATEEDEVRLKVPQRRNASGWHVRPTLRF